MAIDTFIFCISFQVTVSEHLPPGSAIITVTATDHDSGENGKITYRVMSSTKGVFYVDPNNGEIAMCIFRAVYNHLHVRREQKKKKTFSGSPLRPVWILGIFAKSNPNILNS